MRKHIAFRRVGQARQFYLSSTPLSHACVSVIAKPPERVQEEENPFLFLRA